MDGQDQHHIKRSTNSTAYHGQSHWNRLSSVQEIEYKKKLALKLAMDHASGALLNNASLIYVSEQTTETNHWGSEYTVTVEVEVLRTKDQTE